MKDKLSYVIILVTALFILVHCSMVQAGDLQLRVLVHASEYVGVTNKEDPAKIKQILGYVGLSPNQPYCMSTVVYMYHLACMDLKRKDVLPKVGRVSTIYWYAKNNPLKYKVITPLSVTLGTSKLQPGDISIYSRNGGPSATNFNGHTGVVVEQQSQVLEESIEGNTSYSKYFANGDEGNGTGIYRKLRYINKPNGNLLPKGFIRLYDN